MNNKSLKLLTSSLLFLALTQNAIASGQSSSSVKNRAISFPEPAEEGDISVNVKAFTTTTCTPQQNSNGTKGILPAIPILVDIFVAVVGGLLEAQKDGLLASYAGSSTSEFADLTKETEKKIKKVKEETNNKEEEAKAIASITKVVKPIKCIKVERIEAGKVDPLMSMEILIDDVGANGSASRLALKKLIVREPAPSKSKINYDTRINYAVTVAFMTVDSEGKERSFSRNLELIPNVPLIGDFSKGKRKKSTLIRNEKDITYSHKQDERFESSIFAKLPSTAHAATIAVSITETDQRYDDAESLSDFFEENSSIIDGVLGDILD